MFYFMSFRISMVFVKDKPIALERILAVIISTNLELSFN